MISKNSTAPHDLGGGKIKEKLSYGWLVAAAGCVLILVGANFQYSFGVFLKPLIKQFGWSRAAISGSVTLRSIISGVMSPFTGGLSDRYGPKILIFIGILFVGAGYLLAARLEHLWQLYVYLSIFVGIGMGLFYTPVVGTVTKWFGAKSAFPNGILLSGFGLSQIIVPPVATHLIIRYGWATCFAVLGLTTLVVGLAAWSFVRLPAQPGALKSGDDRAVAERARTLSMALHSPAFWIIFAVYFIVALCYQMVAIHVVAAAMDEGISAAAAALILTFAGITNTIGRLTMGSLAGRIGNKNTFLICLAIQTPMLFILSRAHSLYVFYLVALVYGMFYAGISPLIPTLSASLFGTASVGVTFGILNLGYTAGISIGPFVGGFVFDLTGHYASAFLSASVIMALTFLSCLALKLPEEGSRTAR
ncbi:MAG: MFS transporter [Desulfobacterales bacterium]|nr:MFS transporter [Desulfobacterales bacterium]